MSITQMAIDTMLAILFGILTLLATIAGIRYKDSICNMIVKVFTGRRRRGGTTDTESSRSPVVRADMQAPVPPNALRHSVYLDWPAAPSPFDMGRVEQLEWQRERDSV